MKMEPNMPFCIKCGEKIPEEASFCPNCGTPVYPAVVVRKGQLGTMLRLHTILVILLLIISFTATGRGSVKE
jgi:predicted amidophosphoribosyltransferase